jgi:GH25 family lysozyme M1 (1,4-beta-N-acetylmuramidase)
MKSSTILAAIAVALCPTNAALIEERASGVQGFDISNWQHNVDFSGAYKSGARFVIIKVTRLVLSGQC